MFDMTNASLADMAPELEAEASIAKLFTSSCTAMSAPKIDSRTVKTISPISRVPKPSSTNYVF